MTSQPPSIKQSIPRHVYKILRGSEWEFFEQQGTFAGSPDDLRDGFIHLSTYKQLQGTLEKHFQGQTDLRILEFLEADLRDDLRWEESRGGQLYPHLYRALKVTEVKRLTSAPCATVTTF